jgi:hypothetical protein
VTLKPLVISVFVIGFLLTACSGEKSETTVAEVTVVPLTPVSTPTQASGPCPTAANPLEAQLRDALNKGEFKGETVSLRLVGCDIVAKTDYTLVNEFFARQVTDKSLTPDFPERELNRWERQVGIPEGIHDVVDITWEGNQPTDAVCEALFPELNCY